jgi:hypothetical protein
VWPKVDQELCLALAAKSRCIAPIFDGGNKEESCRAFECEGVSEPSPADPLIGQKTICETEGWLDTLPLQPPTDVQSLLVAPKATTATSAPLAVTITEFPLTQPNVKPGPIIAAGQRLIFGSVSDPCTGPCDVYEVDLAGRATAVGAACTNRDFCRHTGLAPTNDGGYCYTTVADRYPTGVPYNGRGRPDRIICKTPSGEYSHSLPILTGFVAGLGTGHDGSIWYTDPRWNGVGRIEVTQVDKVRAAYVDPNGIIGYGAITRGPTPGSMWFTAVSIGQVGKATRKGLEFVPLPTKFSDPAGITTGPDGNIWVTQSKVGKIARVTPAGAVTEFQIPTPNSIPIGIAAGPDGALWFTELNGNKIGRITVFGEITEYAIPTADSQPAGITVGPDGNLWFTELKGNKIGRINLPSAGLPTVVEFYNSNLDNYFITANPAEQAAIDSGSAGPGWTRTGSVFASGGSSTVCRFYGSISPGPNSHFYTADANECASLKAMQATTPATQKRWNFESNDFSTTPAVNGACAPGLTPIYRAYNNGFSRGVDSNHRITPSQAAIAAVVARGWSSEGVVMCAP